MPPSTGQSEWHTWRLHLCSLISEIQVIHNRLLSSVSPEVARMRTSISRRHLTCSVSAHSPAGPRFLSVKTGWDDDNVFFLIRWFMKLGCLTHSVEEITMIVQHQRWNFALWLAQWGKREKSYKELFSDLHSSDVSRESGWWVQVKIAFNASVDV